MLYKTRVLMCSILLCAPYALGVYPYGHHDDPRLSHDYQLQACCSQYVNITYLLGLCLGVAARGGQTYLTLHRSAPAMIRASSRLSITRTDIIDYIFKAGIGAGLTCLTHFLGKHIGNLVLQAAPKLKNPHTAQQLKKGFLHGHTTGSLAVLTDLLYTHRILSSAMENQWSTSQELGATLASIYFAHDFV